MIKRIIAASFASVLLSFGLILFGCSSDKPESTSSETQQAQQATQTEEKSDSKYAVTIDGCDVTTDYEGNPAIVITYTWTNNSDEAQMFDVAIDDKAFQNGVELSFATVSYDSDDYDMMASMKEVKPGGTLTVHQAFLLDDESEVTVQCEELFSFSGEILAEATYAVA